jgi:molecular chaperone DnaJ
VAVPLTRDYYAVLGVPRDADRDRLRKAYRALAAELHPDVSDDPDAAGRFRELVEAYEVLSHPDARRRYDRMPGSAHGLFDDLFDRHGTRAAPRARERGEDVRVDATIDAVEAARGTTRGLAFSSTAACARCDGSGAAPGGRRVRCTGCGGSGRIREVGSADRGRLIRFRECAGCRGCGSVVDRPCETCEGEGRVAEDRTIVVTIPPRSADGDQIVLEGEGHAGGRDGAPGDVVVTLLVREAPDAPLLRHLAAAGVACALVLLVVTVVIQ